MSRYFPKADRLYVWLIWTVVASVVAMTCWQTLHLLPSAVEKRLSLWRVHYYFDLATALVAMLILAWRICFALRYRPHAPVTASVLPTVTVVIPVYNEGAQILSTVRSVLASRYPLHQLQVICVDDGSRDDSWHWMKLARKTYPKSVRLIRQPMNSGKRNALLAGFARATGQVFITMDSDSEVLPDTIRHLVSPLVLDKRIGSVAGNVRVLNVTEGAIPKMMDVSFTTAFDFLRSGQSVYGGVFCTPGALSAYRVQVIKPLLAQWGSQTFMGVPATIGEDRALTNLVLASGHRVVYQREAVVLTKVPTQYAGLRRMLLRWARSNVRENLIMLTYVFRRFRSGDSGGGWVRLFGATLILRMTLTEALKCAFFVQLILAPMTALPVLAAGAGIASIVPALVHHRRHGGFFGCRWALPYSFFWMTGLCWISLWGIFTASRSGWLTRDLQRIVPFKKTSTASQPAPAPKVFPKAA